ncbi:MAG TPA: VCBS repeat-containing protein [Saprospiraceae bacterium]|nr:VCBS repeat-containing protein [Saprospiraceae bacterium]
MKKLIPVLSFCILLAACKKQSTLFVLLDGKQTGITFNNEIKESDSLNILNTEFIYNGGGVGIGDLNGDGLQDIIFTGNQVQNKFYLNRGNLRFEDVTSKAGVKKEFPQQWSSGINIVDINMDGKADIYICNTMHRDPAMRRNQLFINEGNDAEGIPHFVESAAAYGIADTTHSSNAQFFDYDNDGDLDLFISTNFMNRRNPSRYVEKLKDGTDINRDRLYRNDPDTSTGHPFFTEVTVQAGIIWEGYSHSALITDFNLDGWPDIYVANDYVTNDLIYINNHDGTFTNKIAGMFKHQTSSSMGSDVADVDNDGRLDIFTTEMLPYYNKRKKLFLNANNYATYVNNETFGYEYQYSRNMLQLNRGINPETGLPVFSDVAFFTGTQETEWSWTPLMADFDNDGNRDIFVTNGFPRDVTDHDFGAYRSSYNYLIPPMDLQEMIPQIKVPKFLFKNEGNLQFKDFSKEWGVAIPAFSNGAACGDLDNDGDLDLVVNNIDDEAFVFQNTANDQKEKNNFVRLKIEGKTPNSDAFGATATIFFEGKKQTAQLVSARGYISASENIIHFGIGKAAKVDSVVVHWSGNTSATLTNIPLNQVTTVKFGTTSARPVVAQQAGIFQNINPADLGLEYVHQDKDFIDFDYQRTLPHKFSEYGPTLTTGDANGDGLDDVYLSGSAYADGTWLFQTPEGKFLQKNVAYKTDSYKREEELGAALFDADGDGDKDLYIVRGGSQHPAGDTLYQDVLCVNDGKGNFTVAKNALPKEASCGQVVRAADFDGDGDTDLFVGGRVMPRAYPKADRSFLLRNDSKEKDRPVFTDVTKEVCPDLEYIGMITDAQWTDFNGDKRPDLILAGEWTPVTFFRHDNGKLSNVTAQSGIADKLGWWSSLAAADFDGDGDTDYMAGSYGQNLYFKGDAKEPLHVYAKDFDGNGFYDPFISCYWLDSLGNRKEYFYHTRDDMMKQLIVLRKKFYSYGAMGEATVQDVFSKKELEGAQILEANWMSSSYIENLGNGKFAITALPWQAQLAPIHGMLPYDVDKDGLPDLLMVGNDFGMELLQGRADAFNGLVLKNMGKNQFRPVELEESHFFVPGDARALAKVRLADGREIIVATQNRGNLRVFAPALSPAQ